MTTISVCVRMRPMLNHQKAQKHQRSRIHLFNEDKCVKVQLTEQKQKIFKFNKVFNSQANQEQVYQSLQAGNLIERVVQGYHSTIFAYGQTGSGKTYTIQGGQTPESFGIIPKAIKDLFMLIKNKSSSDKGYKVFLSYLQIYNQAIYDLIDLNEGKPLKMRWNKFQQFTVQNIFQGQCRSFQQAIKWWQKGQKNKIMGSHKMNNTSSRSHCLLTLRVQSYLLEDPSQQIQSKLEIVDLAGSQRQKVTKSTGVVFKQGIQINKSLFTLRQVISSLYETSTTGKSNILPPYRDSKLTSLLKQSIGGNSYCLMIACLNPTMAHFQQSLQTLAYASMASFINNIPTKNIDPKIQQNHYLRQQNENLENQIKKLQDHIDYLTKLLQNNQCLQCKKNSSKKQNTHSILINDFAQSSQPTGLKQLRKMHKKEKAQRLDISSNLNSSLNQKEYQKIVNKIPANGGGKVIKSTKQIIQSIGMIRDLITSNSSLREKIQSLKSVVQQQQKDTFQLMKQNQVLRDRWQMISVNIKPESQIIGQQAPIAIFQRMVKEQKGEGLRVSSFNSHSNKHQTEGSSLTKINYNHFLKSRNLQKQKQKRDASRRKNRIYSQARRLGYQTYI